MGDDYSSLARVDPQGWSFDTTLIEPEVGFFEYSNWFLLRQDVNFDSVDEFIIVGTSRDSDYNNRSEIIVLNNQFEVIGGSTFSGRVPAITL